MFTYKPLHPTLPFPDENEVLPEGVSHGWFSYKQSRSFGTVVYLLEGKTSEVSVTNVTKTSEPGVGFDDVTYVGRIFTGPGGYVRSSLVPDRDQDREDFLEEPPKKRKQEYDLSWLKNTALHTKDPPDEAIRALADAAFDAETHGGEE